jgi:hypothetical protein
MAGWLCCDGCLGRVMPDDGDEQTADRYEHGLDGLGEIADAKCPADERSCTGDGRPEWR